MSSSYYPDYTFLTSDQLRVYLSLLLTIRVKSDNPDGLVRKDSYREGTVALGIVLSLGEEGTNSYHRVGWFKSLPSQTKFLAGKEKVVTIV